MSARRAPRSGAARRGEGAGASARRSGGRRPRPVTVRPMGPADVGEVMEIERLTYPTPWSRAMFLSELGRRYGLGLVAVEPGGVLGYLMVTQHADVWHILNVSVHPSRRRQGIGALLLRSLFERAEGRAERGFTLEVRISNEPAIRLYRRMGFLDGGVRPRYYSDNGEDALVMWRGGGPEDA
jgi:ribosomal-protein-alanine N-acetyltransferase